MSAGRVLAETAIGTSEPSAAMKPSEILAKAADLIEPEGAWIQGYLSGNDSTESESYLLPGAYCWCALGAIEQVSGLDAISVRRVRMTAERLLGLNSKNAPGDGYPLANWNDRPERTQAEVVAKLREAAALAAAEGQ